VGGVRVRRAMVWGRGILFPYRRWVPLSCGMNSTGSLRKVMRRNMFGNANASECSRLRHFHHKFVIGSNNPITKISLGNWSEC
jgi:hypothetical protein